MHYKNLVLIGSSHVSIESIKQVKEAIEVEKPSIVAVELDKDRLYSLLHPRKKGYSMKGIGLKGWLFALFGAWIEKKIGRIVNVEPGSEMKMAINMARKHNLKLALIDQHIAITLKRFSETLTWKEKWNFVADIFKSIFSGKKQAKEFGIDVSTLHKVPSKELINKIMNYTKRRYPNFYNVLVQERNIVMARNLIHLMKHYPDEKIVAVVGAGHEEGIIKIIKSQ